MDDSYFEDIWLNYDPDLNDLMETFNTTDLYPLDDTGTTACPLDSIQFSQSNTGDLLLVEGSTSTLNTVYNASAVSNFTLENPECNMGGYSSGSSNMTSPVDFHFSPEVTSSPEWFSDGFHPPQSHSQAFGCQFIHELPQGITISTEQVAALGSFIGDTSLISNQQISHNSNYLSNIADTQSEWICETCGKDRKTKRDLERHINSCDPQRAMDMNIYIPRTHCEHCPKTFSRSDNYKRHLLKAHGFPRAARLPRR